MPHRHALIVALIASAGAANAGTYASRADWTASLNGAQQFVETFGTTGDPQGHYAASALADSVFNAYAGNGPSDSDRANHVAAAFVGGHDGKSWTITASNANAANGAFFILDNPADKNNVDNHGAIGDNPADADQGSNDYYLSFYNSGTVLTIDLMPDNYFNAFAFDSLDLAEGKIEIAWGDGAADEITIGGGGSPFLSFFGFTRAGTYIESITIRSLAHQGIAIDNLTFAQAIPLPSAAGLGLAGFAAVGIRRRR